MAKKQAVARITSADLMEKINDLRDLQQKARATIDEADFTICDIKSQNEELAFRLGRTGDKQFLEKLDENDKDAAKAAITVSRAKDVISTAEKRIAELEVEYNALVKQEASERFVALYAERNGVYEQIETVFGNVIDLIRHAYESDIKLDEQCRLMGRVQPRRSRENISDYISYRLRREVNFINCGQSSVLGKPNLADAKQEQ